MSFRVYFGCLVLFLFAPVKAWGACADIKSVSHSDGLVVSFTDARTATADVLQASEGRMVYDSSTKTLRLCDGDEWVYLAQSEKNTAIPAGAVMAFDLDTCPEGWSVLASAAGRFVVGAGTEYSKGSTGGLNSVTLTTAQMPKHTHSGTTASSGAHTHTASADSAGAHTHTASTGSAGAHNHRSPDRVFEGLDSWGNWQSNTGTRPAYDGSRTFVRPYTSTDGAHTHSVTVNSAGAHTHNVTVSSAGAHTHSFTTSEAGSGAAHENRPPYLALLYCKKD